MQKNKLENSVVYLDRNSLTFFSTKKTKPFIYTFPPNLVSDLEIKNTTELAKALKTFLDANRLGNARISLILSKNTYFEKDLSEETDEDEREVESARFESILPFANVGVRLFKAEKGYKIIGLNRDFWEGIQEILNGLGLITFSVVPVFVINNSLSDKPFDVNSAKNVIRKFDSLAEFSFLSHIIVGSEEEISKSIDKKTTNILVVIFFALIIVLLIVIVISRLRPAPKLPPAANKITQSPKPTEIITPTIVASPSATVNPKQIRIEILNGSGKSGKAESFRKEFVSAGFTSITTGTSPVSQNSATTIFFSSTISQEIKDKVINVVSISYPKFTSQEGASPDFDIIITIGSAL